MVADRPLDAVTFDFWQTIVEPVDDRYREVRLAAVTAHLRSAGAAVEQADVERAFVGLFEVYQEQWAANQQFTATEAVAVLLERLGVERLGVELSSGDRAELIEVFAESTAEVVPALTPNVEVALAALSDLDLRLGIVCDVGMTPSTVLRRYLNHHGVLDHFDHWSFSDEVGVYKPHRRIFEHALDGLGGVAPERTAHVGDLRRTDVAGALEMGMVAVRYRGSNDDAGSVGDIGELIEAHHVVDDHADLVEVLGLT